MKKFLTLLAALLLVGSVTVKADITIKGKVPAEWTNAIHVFLYGTDADGFHAATHDGDWWSYTYTGLSSSINAIFVNGNDWGGDANQTVDITGVTTDACYQISTNGSNKCSAVSIDCSGAPVEPTTIIIKGKVPAEWTNDISVYLYDTDADGFHAATHDGDWWSYTYTGLSSSINAIFINGNDWSGGDVNQTVDITGVTSDACYQISTNGSNKCSAVSIDCLGAPVEPTTPPSVELKGEWDNWTEAVEFAGDATSVSATKTLTAGNYNFKIILDGTDWRSNGHTYHRDYTGASGITGNSDDMVLQADADGEYTITWTFETNALEITFPEAPAVVGDATLRFMSPRTESGEWERVYAYAWLPKSPDVEVLSDPWPGTEITGSKSGEWYSYTVQKGASLIFSDGSKNQTYDITNIQADACYVPNRIDVPATPEEQTKVAFASQCTVEYYITGDEGIAGAGNAWNAAVPALKMDENNQIVLSSLPAGIYEFKITNGSWAWSIGGKEHLKSNCSQGALTSGSGNVKFKTTESQDITITYYPATQEICLGGVTSEPYEEVRSGLTAGNYYTICWPKAMVQIQGATLWSFAGKDANMAYLIQEDAPFAAGKPYIVYATDTKLEAVLDGADAAAGSNNGLYGTLVYMDAAALDAAGATYMLKSNELRPIGTNNHLDVNRAYIKLGEIPDGGAPAGLPPHRVRSMPMQKDAATGIDNVQGNNVQCTKVLVNGQLFILRGEKMYDTTGKLVK